MYPALPPLALSLRNQKYIFRSTKDSALVVNALGASIDLILIHDFSVRTLTADCLDRPPRLVFLNYELDFLYARDGVRCHLAHLLPLGADTEEAHLAHVPTRRLGIVRHEHLPMSSRAAEPLSRGRAVGTSRRGVASGR